MGNLKGYGNAGADRDDCLFYLIITVVFLTSYLVMIIRFMGGIR